MLSPLKEQNAGALFTTWANPMVMPQLSGGIIGAPTIMRGTDPLPYTQDMLTAAGAISGDAPQGDDVPGKIPGIPSWLLTLQFGKQPTTALFLALIAVVAALLLIGVGTAGLIRGGGK